MKRTKTTAGTKKPPAATPDEERLVPILVRVPEKVRDELKRRASAVPAGGVSLSAYTRDVLRRHTAGS